MKKVILLLFLISATFMNSQSSWKKINLEKITLKSERVYRKSSLSKFDLYSLSIDNFKKEIATDSVILLPFINGKLAKFHIKEVSNFTTPISTKYGYIKSFSIKGVNDKNVSGKISIGTNGIFVTISSADDSTFFIDPYTKDKKIYTAYKRSSLVDNKSNFNCLTKQKLNKAKKSNSNISKRNANDSKLRFYKLALICTGEYAQYHIKNQGLPNNASDTQKKAAVLSAMNTTITKVNGIYERDLAVRMNIVLNANGENPLLFLNPNTDKLSNNDANALLEESQKICDSIIGNNNYDIGHAFSTGSSGLAYIGAVCNNSVKANGVTGITDPINDPFDIDYVCHEIGHQFGAFHTFNNSCEGQRSSKNSVEPGSGSTIMGYAGICPKNIQNNSDGYFGSVSIANMWEYIKNNATCSTEINTNNTAPIANAGSDVSVPKSTPLMLKGNATDANNSNNLTYCWEQIDPEKATMPPVSTSSVGPLFRSLPPTSSPNRYLPKLETVISGNSRTLWEVLPSVSRIMNFSLLVRDNNINGGATARDDIKITVTNSEPFVITSQNTDVTWDVNTNQIITWNKALTDQAPINCSNVRIKLSTDGGLTFPKTLVESTPNDGRHSIIIPNIPTSKARIMVEATDNIFYNVNSANFIISNSSNFLVKNNTYKQTICNNTYGKTEFSLSFKFLNGFNETIYLSAAYLPKGAKVNFNPSSISADGNVIMSISNLKGAIAQSYPIEITASTSSVTKKIEAFLTIKDGSLSTLLTSPNNTNKQVKLRPKLEWTTSAGATSYNVEIASDNNFQNIILTSNSTTNSYTLTSNLEYSTTYYWRVKPNGNCGEGNYSTIFNFTTIAPTIPIPDFYDFLVYPNPSEGNVNLRFKPMSNDNVIIRLFNLRGKLIETKEFLNNSTFFLKKITFNNVSGGLYLLQINNGNNYATKKIILK